MHCHGKINSIAEYDIQSILYKHNVAEKKNGFIFKNIEI